MRITQYMTVAIAAALLSACGGGGSSDESSGSESSVLGAYVGTWRGDCTRRTSITQSGSPMYEQETYVITQSGDDLSTVFTTKLYAPTDTTCTGSAAATHTRAAFLMNHEGSFNGTLAGQAITGQTFSGTVPAIGGLSGGTQVTVNNITYPGDYFTRTSSIKPYTAVKDGAMYLGTSTALTATDKLTKVI
jgi:hypothetical protein